jgi:hypothetical protein
VGVGSIYGIIVGITFGIVTSAVIKIYDVGRNRDPSVQQVMVSLVIFVLGFVIGVVSGLARDTQRWISAPVDLVGFYLVGDVERGGTDCTASFTVVDIEPRAYDHRWR